MYQGNNPSAKRSQQWIAQSLLALMQEKPFQAISIKEIMRKSDLSRQTFYQLFSSKEEVIEFYLDGLFADFLTQIQEKKINSVQQLAELYFEFYSLHKNFIKLLFANNLAALLKKQFERYLGVLKNNLHDGATVLDCYLQAFISAGLVGILEYYSQREQTNASEVTGMLAQLLNEEYLGFRKQTPLVRKATSDDLTQIEEIYAEHFAHERTRGAYTVFQEGVYPTRQTAENALRREALYVIESGGAVAGCVIADHDQPPEYAQIKEFSPLPAQKVIVVHLLMIRPSMKGQGLATTLLNEILARAEGAEVARLDTGKQNVPALSLYKKCGFVIKAARAMNVGGSIPHAEHLFLEKTL